ncbi:MAG: Type secretion bridge between inner and outerrane lipoprotein [Myxococcales bacterium]|nr:Type secretion bridge between inner and outerrane lipoprotein [Myxococcales bacterium]
MTTWRGRGRLAIVTIALLMGGCSTNVLQGIDQRGANEAARALERAGIGAEKVPEQGGGGASEATFTLRVSGGDGARALDLLRALGLPREKRRGFAETYGQPSLIPTPSEERARYIDALAGELERTLEAVDGVVSARVHLVLEDNDPLAQPSADGKPRSPARAAVLLATGAGRTPMGREDVQKLVAGSVAGLDVGAVAVVFTTAPAAPEGEPTMTAVGPLRVTPGSRGLLIAGLAAGLGLLGVLAGLLIMTARRLSALERAAPPR